MEHQDDKGKRASQPTKRKRKNRDDTPSFIRNVQSRAEMLNPARQSLDSLPVLTMPKSVKIWRKVRWPLAVLIVVVVLGTVGLITNDMLVARSVKRTIAEAQQAEMLGSVDQIRAAGQTLAKLAERHPSRTNAQMSWAWHGLLQAILFGPERELTDNVKEALKLGGDDASAVGWAARAAYKHVNGENDQALELVDRGLKEHAGEARLALVQAWALRGLGKHDEAREAFQTAMDSSIEYMPLVIAGIAFEYERGDRLRALNLAERLLEVSPGHLYASLITVALALPEWGDTTPSRDRIASLLKDIQTLTPVIEEAPPKLSFLGNRLIGRVNLLAGRYKDAAGALEKTIEISPEPELLAWYALALQQMNGPEAALKFIEKYPDVVAPELLDIRARSLLAYHRVHTGAEAIKKLSASGKLQKSAKELEWVLAVRSGDREQSLATMPEQIGHQHQLLAAELYFWLKAVSDVKGIERLTAAMDSELGTCAEAIRAWHKNAPGNAFQALKAGAEIESPCVDALALKLLRGHVIPEELRAISQRLEKSAGLNLWSDIDSALSKWPIEGRDIALEMLNDVWQLRPEGAPLRCALAEAYLELGAPKKALDVLDNVEAPEGIALHIEAARKAGKKKLVSKLIQTAIARSKELDHPALLYVAVQSRFSTGKIGDVFEEVLEKLNKAGRYASELAEIGAKTLNFKGDRTVADRVLYQSAKQITKYAGLDESWEMRLAQIRLNLRRGGKFMFRALYLISTLKEEGVRDPRITYQFAMANLSDGNERVGLRELRDTLELDPTFAPAYKQLISMNRLDDELSAWMKRTRPELVQ